MTYKDNRQMMKKNLCCKPRITHKIRLKAIIPRTELKISNFNYIQIG